MKNIVICIFGSSIMEGIIEIDDPKERWYEILRDKLRDRFPDTCFSVINSAIGAQSTRECMARFDRDILGHNPDYLLVMCAGNNGDLVRPERNVTLEEFERLNEDMVARLPSKTKVVGIGLGPLIHEWHWVSKNELCIEHYKKIGMDLDQELNKERDSFRAFIKSRNLPFYDLYDTFGKEPKKYLLPDGAHLNKLATRIFGEDVFKLMESLIVRDAEQAK